MKHVGVVTIASIAAVVLMGQAPVNYRDGKETESHHTDKGFDKGQEKH